MADNEASFKILVDAKEAIDNIEEFAKSGKESIEHVQEAIEGFKSVAEAALAVFAFEKIKEFLGEAIDLAAQQEAGQRRLATAMALTGEYTQEAAADMNEFAEALQANSRFSEEAITNSLSVAKSFGATNDMAKELVQTAADMATQFGTDLGTQVQKLSVTLSGNVGLLARQVPALKNFSSEQLKAGAAVEYLSERFSGAAEAGIHTYEGATKQASNAQEDLIKSIGRLITDNPIAVARIEAFTESLRGAKEWVDENKDSLEAFVNLGLTVMVEAVPLAVNVLDVLGTAFFRMGEAGALVTAELIHIVGGMAQVFNDTFGAIISDMLDFIAEIAAIAEAIPGASTALDAMGVSSDGLSTSVTTLREQFDGISHQVVNDADDMENAIYGFVDGAESKYSEFRDSANEFEQNLADGAQKILDADAKTAESAQLANSKRSEAMGLSAKAIQALEKELEKLDQAIFNSIADPSDKASAEYEKNMDKLAEIDAAHIIGSEEIQKRALQIQQIYSDKMLAIRQGELDAEAAAEAKAIADHLAELNNASSDPVSMLVHLKVSDEDIQSIQEDITPTEAAIVGAAGKLFSAMQQGGQAGASTFLSGVGGGIAGAFGGPAVGNAVSQILQFAFQDPAVQRAQEDSFVRAQPKMIANLMAFVPTLLGTLLEELLNKEYWAEIAEDLGQALVLGSWWKEIGRAIGIHFGDSLNSSRIFSTVPAEWHKDMAWMDDFGKTWGRDFTGGTKELPAAMDKAVTDLQNALAKFGLDVKNLPSEIAAGFHDGEAYLSGHFAQTIKQAGEELSKGVYNLFVKDIWVGFVKPMADAITKPFQDFLGGVEHAFKSAFDAINWPPKFEEPGWLKSFTGAIDKFTGGSGGGVGGGGKGGIQVGGYTVPTGFGLTGASNRSFSSASPAAATTTSDSDPLSQVVGLLAQLVSLAQQPMTVQTTAKVDSRAFADISLQLSRQNARTRA